MGLSKKEFMVVAEELGRVQNKEDQRIISDFLVGVIPLIKTTFDEDKFRKEVEHQYYLNYGN